MRLLSKATILRRKRPQYFTKRNPSWPSMRSVAWQPRVWPVTYGAMSKEALKIPNGFLIFRDLRFRGFWLTRWLREADPAERAALFAEVYRLAGLGCFRPRVAATFPMAQAREAVALAASGSANGKVLLRLDG